MLGRTSSLLCCYSPIRGRVCSSFVGAEAPRSGSKLWCEVGRIETLLPGKEPLYIFPQELSTWVCAL